MSNESLQCEIDDVIKMHNFSSAEIKLASYGKKYGEDDFFYLRSAEIAYFQANYQKALEHFNQVESASASPGLLNIVGICYQHLGEVETAKNYFLLSVDIDEKFVDGYYSLGCLGLANNDLDLAGGAFLKVIDLNTNHVMAYNNLAVTLIYKKDYEAAIEILNGALSIDDTHLDIIDNLFYILYELKSVDNIFRLAVHAENKIPGLGRAPYFYAMFYKLKHMEDKVYPLLKKAYLENYRGSNCIPFLVRYACISREYDLIPVIEQDITFSTDTVSTVVELIHAYSVLGDFDKVALLKDGVNPYLDKANFLTPFNTLSFVDDAHLQKRIAEKYASRYQSSISSLPRRSPSEGRPIKIGYLSADFNKHAVGFLFKPILENHNYEKFEIFLYSLTATEDEYTHAFKEQAKWVSCVSMSSFEVASKIRQDEIDILVNLSGLSSGLTGAIEMHQPAAIQTHLIGYPGTMGTQCIDYYISTKTGVPESMHSAFVEKIAYLPESDVTIPSLDIARPTLSRADLGLPEDKFVFGCLNAAYRIDEACFMAWLDILAQTENTVLCFSSENDEQYRRFQERAVLHDISPERLVAIKSYTLSETWHNMLLDLYLDTFTIAGATAALLNMHANVPMLTLAGNTPQSRTSAIVLSALDLNQLISNDVKDYVNKAVELASNPNKLARYRDQIRAAKENSAIFNPSIYILQLESLYREIIANYE